ncbi:MAG: DUF4397 domain-containing protein [Planctomycetota bacterium]
MGRTFVTTCLALLLMPSIVFATAEVRVAHLSPDAPAVDVWVDGELALSNVSFGQSSAFLPLPSGSTQFQVTPTGQQAPIVIDATLPLQDGVAYTIAATGLLGSNDLQPVVLTDDRSSDSTSSKVRFFHGSPDAPAVDIAVANGGPVVFGNVSFRGDSGYSALAPGDYDLEVRLAGTATVVLPLGTLTLDPGFNYEAIALGLVGDNTLAATILVTAQPPKAEVRVAHLSPDAPNVDVWVDGAIALADVPFQAISGYLQLDAGPHNFQVTPTGQTMPVVINADVTLVGGESYTVAATGLLGAADLQPLVLVDDRDSDPAQGEVRFVHTSPDAPAVDVALANGGAVLFPNQSFRDASPYLAIAPGVYDLEVRLAGTNTVVLPVPGVTVAAGVNATALAIGLVSDSTLGAQLAVDVNEVFVRGDVDRDGGVSIVDVIVTLTHLFQAPVPGFCGDAADFSDDGHLSLQDPVQLLSYLFGGGASPAAPFPQAGTDTSSDELNCRS